MKLFKVYPATFKANNMPVDDAANYALIMAESADEILANMEDDCFSQYGMSRAEMDKNYNFDYHYYIMSKERKELAYFDGLYNLAIEEVEGEAI